MRYLPLPLVAFCLTLPSAFLVPPDAQADPGIYVGAGLGVYSLEVDDFDLDEGDLTARVLAGYRITDHLALEAEYQSLFESDNGISEIEVDAWSIALRAILPISDLIEIYGKAGWATYEVDVRIAGLSFNDTEGDFVWGGGVDISLGELTLRGEITRIEVEDADLNLFSVGIVYSF